jgi:flavin-binding protein dodecin
MEGYMTKYCLSRGIEEVHVEDTHDGIYRYTVGMYRIQLKVGSEFFESKDDAEANARERARKKVKSLRRAMERMKRLEQQPLWSEKCLLKTS